MIAEARTVRFIELLCEDEGSSINILCPNPDGEPNRAVVCNGYWTGWKDARFTGDTLLDALESAVKSFELRK